MLRIRLAQVEAFRAAVRTTFVRRLHAYLALRAPDYLADLQPEAVEAEVDALISRAEKLGFLGRDQIRRYAVVEAVATGRAGSTPPDWLAEIADQPRPSAPLRLIALEDALIHQGPVHPGDIL